MKATIVESYSLPSKGLIYKTPFNPDFTIRSMTLAEEMRRLQVSEDTYRPMSDVIDDCLETKLPISSYDMCLGDYQFLLHKLRIVTYGTDYKLTVICPRCGAQNDINLNLDSLNIIEAPNDFERLTLLTLPKTGSTVRIKFQTPRMLDTIAKERKEMKKQFPDLQGDPTMLITLQNTIEEVDGRKMSRLALQEFIKELPMQDINYLIQSAAKLNSCVGVDPIIDFTCKECGGDEKASFRFTPEFFTPTY